MYPYFLIRDDFRRGIVQGDKPVIYPVLEWLLQHLPELKERAYLARYLVKVDIPQDFMIDSQIAELYEQVCICQQVTNVLECIRSGKRWRCAGHAIGPLAYWIYHKVCIIWPV